MPSPLATAAVSALALILGGSAGYAGATASSERYRQEVTQQAKADAAIAVKSAADAGKQKELQAAADLQTARNELGRAQVTIDDQARQMRVMRQIIEAPKEPDQPVAVTDDPQCPTVSVVALRGRLALAAQRVRPRAFEVPDPVEPLGDRRQARTEAADALDEAARALGQIDQRCS